MTTLINPLDRSADLPQQLRHGLCGVITERARPFKVSESEGGIAALACVYFATGQILTRILAQAMSWPPWTSPVLFWLIGFGLLALWRRSVRSKLAKPIRGAFLEHGYCPSCAYSMSGLAPQQDGLTVCPECSAAWRMPTELRTLRADLPASAQWPISRWPYWRRPQNPHTLDSAGHLVPLIEPDVSRFPPPCWHSIPFVEQRRIDRWLFNSTLGNRALGALICALFLAFGLRYFLGVSAKTYADTATYMILIAAGLFAGASTIMLRPAARAPKVIDFMVHSGRCPSCAASVPLGAPAIECIRCSSCGAYWGRAPESPPSVVSQATPSAAS